MFQVRRSLPMLTELDSKSTKRKTVMVEIISALLILLFVYAAISKLINYNLFVFTLSQSPLISSSKSSIAWLIPCTELIISLLLFVPRWKHFGLLSSAILMSIFTIYIGYMLLFVPELPCSCGGIIQKLNWKEHLVFNIFFTFIAYAGYIFSIQTKDFIAINRRSRKPVETSRQILEM
jgi:hypothetical protein